PELVSYSLHLKRSIAILEAVVGRRAMSRESRTSSASTSSHSTRSTGAEQGNKTKIKSRWSPKAWSSVSRLLDKKPPQANEHNAAPPSSQLVRLRNSLVLRILSSVRIFDFLLRPLSLLSVGKSPLTVRLTSVTQSAVSNQRWRAYILQRSRFGPLLSRSTSSPGFRSNSFFGHIRRWSLPSSTQPSSMAVDTKLEHAEFQHWGVLEKRSGGRLPFSFHLSHRDSCAD
ncbi:hypothetical protein BKA62DRAFT_731918, partial [Auriculariales sp. MPI-PUGE-AT-0066]